MNKKITKNKTKKTKKPTQIVLQTRAEKIKIIDHATKVYDIKTGNSPIISARVHELRDLISNLITKAIKIHRDAQKALDTKDKNMALKIIRQDYSVDLSYNRLLQEATFLLTQQPLAKELRRVIGYLHIGRDVEHIADCAVRVAKFIISNDNKISPSSQRRILTIHNLLFKSLNRINDVICTENVDGALSLAHDDEIVDNKIVEITKEIILSITKKDSIDLVDERVFVFKVIDALELAADKIVSICETVVYIKSGFLHGLE